MRFKPNQKQAAGKMLTQVTEMGTKQQFTAPYTAREPDGVSKWDGENNDSAVRRGDQRNWHKKWPEIMLAVNSSVSESTGYTPSFISKGREP